ncbi:MAG: hypothetical protein R2778_16075 [Saprospiraceae bacterium]
MSMKMATAVIFPATEKTCYGKDDIFQFFAPKGIEGNGLAGDNRYHFCDRPEKQEKPFRALIGVTSDGWFYQQQQRQHLYTLDLVQRQDDPNAYTMKLVRKGASECVPTLLSNVEGKALTDFTRYKNTHHR